MRAIAVALAILGLSACGTSKPAEETAGAAPAAMKAAAAPPRLSPPAPAPVAIVERAYRPAQAATAHRTVRPASVKSASAKPATAKTGPENPASQVQRIDAYFAGLKTAAYTFNPPSPIRVAEPVTVHLWLDPQATAAELADELRRAMPNDAARVESGATRWSPRMRATLSGPDFEVTAIDPEEQLVSSAQRTTWSWDITPLHAGEKLALHLRLAAVLPSELGPPKTIATLDREIRVEVTWWWLFDHHFEKYWKWLLGGLGTALASAIAWWWKNRKGAIKNA